jgi:hypothetical protein
MLSISVRVHSAMVASTSPRGSPLYGSVRASGGYDEELFFPAQIGA